MKHTLSVFISFTIFLLLPTYAETFFEPEWSEFCPAKYSNVDTGGHFLSSTAKYWAGRKQMFDKRVAQCKSLESAKQGQCYEELRQLEINATKRHNDEIKTNAINRASIWGTSSFQLPST